MKRILIGLLIGLLYIPVAAQEFRTVADGVEYAEVTRGTKEEPNRINLVRLDLSKVRLDVKHAHDLAIGVEATSSIARRFGAIAAINAGFFRLDTSLHAGDAAGVLKIDGMILSEPFNNRIAIFINNASAATRVSFAHFSSEHKLKIGRTELTVAGLNRQRKNDETVIFTPYFGRTTLTDTSGVEIVVRRNYITRIADGHGSTDIPHDGYIVSATGRNREELLKYARVGRRVDWFESGEGEAFRLYNQAEDVTNGVPQLIKDGRIDITWEKEKSNKAFAENRHPRTAVAMLSDGRFLMMTVDGRQPGVSVGMTLKELADYLLEIGAVDAINLDGGGSTVMYLEGKVVNKPSDKEGERKVGDAIIVTLRNR